jgi:hypothetical protein
MRCNNPSSPIPSTPIHPINITPCTNIQTQAASTAQPYAHAEFFAQSRCTSNKLWRPKGPKTDRFQKPKHTAKGRSATPRALSPGASAHPSGAPNTLPSPPPFQQFLPPRSNHFNSLAKASKTISSSSCRNHQEGGLEYSNGQLRR